MTATHATVRRATPDDATDLAALEARTFHATYLGQMSAEALDEHVRTHFTAEKQAAELTDPDCRILVAEWRGAMVGYAMLRDSTPPAGADTGATIQLQRLYVDARAQARGVGAALFEHAVDAALARGHEWIWLTVWERNARAIAVYRHWRFVDVGQVTFELAGEEQTDRVLARRLATDGFAS